MHHRSAVWLLLAHAWCIGCAIRADPVLKKDFRNLCWPSDGEVFALPRFQESGEPGRRALLSLAESSNSKDADCGIGGLAMLVDTRVVPEIADRLRRSKSAPTEARPVLDRTLQLTSRVPASLAVELLPLIDALDPYLEHEPLRAFAIIGHIEHPAARAVLRRELTTSAGDRLQSAIFGEAEQGGLGAIDEIGKRIDHPDLSTLAGQQRLTFYFLAADASTVPEGLRRLDQLPADDRILPAGWAVQTLCLRAIRRRDEAAIIDQHRSVLKSELFQRRIGWLKGLLPGRLVCDVFDGRR